MENDQKLGTGASASPPDYAADKKRVEDGGQWLKFKEGETIVSILGEMSEEYDRVFESDKSRVRDLEVEVNGIRKTWSLKVGGERSTYFKVLEIAEKYKRLAGAKLRVTRNGTKKDNTVYTIVYLPPTDDDPAFKNTGTSMETTNKTDNKEPDNPAQ